MKGGYDVKGRMRPLMYRGNCDERGAEMCYSTNMRLRPLPKEDLTNWTSMNLNSIPMLYINVKYSV